MTIGLFAPLPLAIMIPFMAAQSAAIGQAFGTHFQYAKRKISSMSNEEFNKLTPEQLMQELTADIRSFIPHVSRSFDDMEKLQTIVIDSLLDSVRNLPSDLVTSLSQPSSSPSAVSSLTGGLPAVDSGLGNMFEEIAKGIGQLFNFNKDTGAGKFFSEISKAKAQNKANQPLDPELVKQVQEKNIQKFQTKLQSESDQKKLLRGKIESRLQSMANAIIQATKAKNLNKKADFQKFLKIYHQVRQDYETFRKQFNKLAGKEVYPFIPIHKF